MAPYEVVDTRDECFCVAGEARIRPEYRGRRQRVFPWSRVGEDGTMYKLVACVGVL